MQTRDTTRRFESLGIRVPRVMLPRKEVDFQKWAVIACDQFTSDPSYWQRVERFVGANPSSLRLVLPELYLTEPDVAGRVAAILGSMNDYIERDIIEELDEGFVLVRRRTRSGAVRTGLLAAIDLEHYDYRSGATSLIRATEGTIPDRIPPRTMVRRGASLELPHVLVLYDDPTNKVVGRLESRVDEYRTLYDFDLMENSGHISGYHVADEDSIQTVFEEFSALADREQFTRRHNRKDVLLFAVGDGNHSLAAAKTVWEEIKSGGDAADDHPGRDALVELVNIHDPGLEFEPIHRVLFGGGERLLARIRETPGVRITPSDGYEDMIEQVSSQEPTATHSVGLVTVDGFSLLRFDSPSAALPAASLGEFLDDFLRREANASLDYIHGEESTLNLGRKPGNVGFFLPPVAKSDFFEMIVRDGSFPRKTFSMGDADEKRFYLEARRIVPA